MKFSQMIADLEDEEARKAKEPVYTSLYDIRAQRRTPPVVMSSWNYRAQRTAEAAREAAGLEAKANCCSENAVAIGTLWDHVKLPIMMALDMNTRAIRQKAWLLQGKCPECRAPVTRHRFLSDTVCDYTCIKEPSHCFLMSEPNPLITQLPPAIQPVVDIVEPSSLTPEQIQDLTERFLSSQYD